MLRIQIVAASLGAIGVAIVLAACGDDGGHMGGMSDMHGANASAPPGTIVVELRNWAIEPSQSSAVAGEVTFRATYPMSHMHMTQEGGATHDLAVARKNDDGSYAILGQVKDIRMGQHKDLKLTLLPGEYELQCNVVEEVTGKTIAHYIEGMRAPFTVS